MNDDIPTLLTLQQQLRRQRGEHELSQHGLDGRPSCVDMDDFDPLLERLLEHHIIVDGHIYERESKKE
jgi:hypothetical protein